MGPKGRETGTQGNSHIKRMGVLDRNFEKNLYKILF